MKKVITVILSLFILVLLTIWAYNTLYNKPIENTNVNIDQAENSDWLTYRNEKLSYEIKFPSSFKAYSEMTGEEIKLKNDAKSIFMNDIESSIGFIISQSSTGGNTTEESFYQQAQRDDTDNIYINGNAFVYDKYTKHYFVKTNNSLLVIQFLAELEEDREYISEVILNSFYLID